MRQDNFHNKCTIWQSTSLVKHLICFTCQWRRKCGINFVWWIYDFISCLDSYDRMNVSNIWILNGFNKMSFLRWQIYVSPKFFIYIVTIQGKKGFNAPIHKIQLLVSVIFNFKTNFGVVIYLKNNWTATLAVSWTKCCLCAYTNGMNIISKFNYINYKII